MRIAPFAGGAFDRQGPLAFLTVFCLCLFRNAPGTGHEHVRNA